MSEPGTAPHEFVSYVDKRLRALEGAALRLTGDEVPAARIAREFMTIVALRWRSHARHDQRHGLVPGTSADMHLAKLLRQEAADYGYPQMSLNLDAAVPMGRHSALTGNLPVVYEAGLIWDAARGRLRRRIIIAAAVGAVVAIGALSSRGGGGSDEQPEAELPLPPQSTDLPPGAIIMSTNNFDLVPIQPIPPDLRIAHDAGALSASPIARAVLLAGSPDAIDGRVFALADDGTWRHVDAAPQRAATWIDAGTLSPDGKRAAFLTESTGMIVEMATGQAQSLPGIIITPNRPVWLSNRQLLLGRDALLDLDTGKFDTWAFGPQDAVTPRGPGRGERAETLTELLSIGQPLTAPARIQTWRLDQPEVAPQATVPLSGQLASIVGPWHGPGVGFGEDLVARLCLPGTLPGRPTVGSIVAVMRPKSGEVAKTLLVDSSISGDAGLVGWQDERRVLFTLVKGGTQQIVSWDLLADRVTRVAAVDFAGVVSLRDLTVPG